MACRSVRRPAATLALILTVATGCGTGKSADSATIVPATQTPTSAGSPTPAATPTGPLTTAPPAATPTARPTSPPQRRYAFPVRAANASYGRTHSGYPATDIFAACGSPVVAATDGVVLEVNRVDRYDPDADVPADRGGLSVSLLGRDGVRYYGSHLVAIEAGISIGVRVRAGQRIGKVGKTGRANGVCHLHFGISPPCASTGDWWIRRGVVAPAKYLDAWRRNRAQSPVSTVNSWHRRNGCPAEPASA